MASTKIQWNLWVCCSDLPGEWTGNWPSLSKCYCDVKTAARLFLKSLITVAGRWASKDKTLSPSKISKWNFTNVYFCPHSLLCFQQAAKKQRGSFKGCLSIRTSMALAMKGETEGRAKWGLMPPWNRLLCWEHTCCYANGTGLYFSI